MTGFEDIMKDDKKEELPRINFEPINNIPGAKGWSKRGLKVGIYGEYGTGKTHFGLTSPAPIFIVDTEFGVDPVANRKIFHNKKIFMKSVLELDADSYEKDDVKTLKNVESLIATLKDKKQMEGTVIIDSMSDIWSMIQSWAKVEIYKMKPTDKFEYQFFWATPNAKYQNLLLTLLSLNTNLILTARASPDYDGSGRIIPGSFSPKWQKNTPFLLDIVLFAEKRMTATDTIMKFTVEKCRFSKRLVGRQYENTNWETIIADLEKVCEEE